MRRLNGQRAPDVAAETSQGQIQFRGSMDGAGVFFNIRPTDLTPSNN